MRLSGRNSPRRYCEIGNSLSRISRRLTAISRASASRRRVLRDNEVRGAGYGRPLPSVENNGCVARAPGGRAVGGRCLQYGTRRVRAVHRWGTELADLHHVPQRLLHVAQLKLEEAKLRLVKTAVEEDEAGGIIQGVAELITGGNQFAFFASSTMRAMAVSESSAWRHGP